MSSRLGRMRTKRWRRNVFDLVDERHRRSLDREIPARLRVVLNAAKPVALLQKAMLKVYGGMDLTRCHILMGSQR